MKMKLVTQMRKIVLYIIIDNCDINLKNIFINQNMEYTSHNICIITNSI